MRNGVRVRVIFTIIALFVVSIASGQTSISQRVISNQKGFDENPRLVKAASGKYAVIWRRALAGDDSLLLGRLVNVSGTQFGAIRPSLLGTQVYRHAGFDVISNAGGGFLLMDTRNSDRQLIARSFDSGFRPLGSTLPSGNAGFSPNLVPSSPGFAIAFSDGNGAAFVGHTDEHGRFTGTTKQLKSPRAGNGFSVRDMLPNPIGGFLILGFETNADKGRASGFTLKDDLSSSSALISYDSSLARRPGGIAASFESGTGLLLFSHVVGDSQVSGKSRALRANGSPSGGGKTFPASATGFTRDYRIVAITGTGKYVVSWEDPSQGKIFLRILDSRGVPLSSAVPVSSNPHTYPAGLGDLVWDQESQTLLAVWTEYPPAPISHSDIRFAAFKLQ